MVASARGCQSSRRTLRPTRGDMALHTCRDCGDVVSSHASACPNCGCPMGATAPTPGCPHCGSESVSRVRGLQGPIEVLVGIILLICFVIPGVLFYIVQEGKPYCSRCGRRVS